MDVYRPLTLSLILSASFALGCDDGDSSAELGPELGLGDLGAELIVRADVSPTAPSAAAPTSAVGLAPAMAPETTSASVGLPSREQDGAGWVQWSGSLPYSTGPVFDETGEQCGEGQDGPIWYLAGTAGGPVERECTIPVGKQIVFPLINYYTVVPESYYTTPEQLADYIVSFSSTGEFLREITCTLTATLDGEPLYADLGDETWVESVDPFEVALPDDPDNIAQWFGLVGGTTSGIGVGYYARTPALAPGDHTLEFGGSLCVGDQVWFETHASYQIHVE